MVTQARPKAPFPTATSIVVYTHGYRHESSIRQGRHMQQAHLKQPELHRPVSAVSNATGMVGLLGLLATVAALSITDLSTGERALACLAGPALPMILWALLMERVYRSPGTGLDLSRPRPLAIALGETRTKLIGLWSTFLLIGISYWLISQFTSGTTIFLSSPPGLSR